MFYVRAIAAFCFPILSAVKRDFAMANFPWPQPTARSSSIAMSSTSHSDPQQGALVPDHDDSTMHHDDTGDEMFLDTNPDTGTLSYVSVTPGPAYTAPMEDFLSVPFTPSPGQWS